MAIADREIVLPTPNLFCTEDEYLALEETAEEKSEYVNGQIRPRPGGTDDHAALAVSLGAELCAALRERDCLVMSCNMKIHIAGQMYYPDLTVVCGPRQYHGASRTVVTNPILVAEVLSPSTESIDRSEKFHHYLAIESLDVYLLVSQDAPRIEQFSRGEEGHWNYTLMLRRCPRRERRVWEAFG